MVEVTWPLWVRVTTPVDTMTTRLAVMVSCRLLMVPFGQQRLQKVPMPTISRTAVKPPSRFWEELLVLQMRALRTAYLKVLSLVVAVVRQQRLSHSLHVINTDRTSSWAMSTKRRLISVARHLLRPRLILLISMAAYMAVVRMVMCEIAPK